jgi:MFS family permease
VLAYLLASTTLIVSAGRPGDVLGRRRLLLGGIALFTVASAACGLAPTLWLMVAARASQGLGAAAMVALAMAFVGEAVPKARTGSAMGLLGTASAVGTALGPTLGGVLVAGFGWPAVFLVSVPLGALALLLAAWCLPAGRHAPRAGRVRFDAVGTVLLASTLSAYALAMTTGRGSFGPVNAALLAAAVLGTGLFVLAERGAAAPLVGMATFRDPVLRAGLAMSALVMTVMMTTLVVGPFYLARGLGLDAAPVGLVMSVDPRAATPLLEALARGRITPSARRQREPQRPVGDARQPRRRRTRVPSVGAPPSAIVAVWQRAGAMTKTSRARPAVARHSAGSDGSGDTLRRRTPDRRRAR